MEKAQSHSLSRQYYGLKISRLAVFVALIVAGAAVKTLGALESGSRALLVDALTCFSSLAGLIAVLHYLRLGSSPPDIDHPYGHTRLRYGGIVVSLAAYMFAAGVSVVAVIAGIEGYSVSITAVPAAIIGALFYGLAIAIGRRLDPVIMVYLGFTVSELLESAISVIGALLGSLMSYVYDLVGAVIILAYIVKEAIEAHHYLMHMVSDTAPEKLHYMFDEEARLRGLEPIRVRLRMLDEHTCIGDAIVKPPREMSPEMAHLLADEIAEKMSEYNCDVTIHIEHEKAEKNDKNSGEQELEDAH
jgi:divalent metal cation (Fe/Co/Zn/Cd) transporter